MGVAVAVAAEALSLRFWLNAGLATDMDAARNKLSIVRAFHTLGVGEGNIFPPIERGFGDRRELSGLVLRICHRFVNARSITTAWFWKYYGPFSCCLDCGFVEFRIDKDELRETSEGSVLTTDKRATAWDCLDRCEGVLAGLGLQESTRSITQSERLSHPRRRSESGKHLGARIRLADLICSIDSV
jgi:hypothetical protein